MFDERLAFCRVPISPQVTQNLGLSKGSPIEEYKFAPQTTLIRVAELTRPDTRSGLKLRPQLH